MKRRIGVTHSAASSKLKRTMKRLNIDMVHPVGYQARIGQSLKIETQVHRNMERVQIVRRVI